MKILHYHFLCPPIPICVLFALSGKQCASLSSVAHLPNTTLQTLVLDRFRALTIRVHIQSTILLSFMNRWTISHQDIYI